MKKRRLISGKEVVFRKPGDGDESDEIDNDTGEGNLKMHEVQPNDINTSDDAGGTQWQSVVETSNVVIHDDD